MSDGQHVAVLGAGLIGAGWAALFAHAGHRVTVIDPGDQARAQVGQACAQARPVLAALGLPQREAPVIDFCARPAQLAGPVSLVQEALPEQTALKQAALCELEASIPEEALIASSSSGCLPSDLQRPLRHPQRLLVAHPCNPPWLMPLVELVGGEQTAPQTLARAEAFYQALGRTTLRLGAELPGHLVNRLQAALWREAVHLVRTGAATVGQVDQAVTQGLGARWACCGPHAIFHLAGGEQGMAGFLDRLGPAVGQWWADLGTPVLDETTRRLLVEGMAAASAGQDVATLAAQRDSRLTHLLRAIQSMP